MQFNTSCIGQKKHRKFEKQIQLFELQQFVGPFAADELSANLKHLKQGQILSCRAHPPRQFIVEILAPQAFSSCFQQPQIPKIWRKSLVIAISKLNNSLRVFVHIVYPPVKSLSYSSIIIVLCCY